MGSSNPSIAELAKEAKTQGKNVIALLSRYESVNGEKECGIKMIEKIQELNQMYGTEFIFAYKSNLANKIVELLSQEKYLDEKEGTCLSVG